MRRILRIALVVLGLGVAAASGAGYVISQTAPDQLVSKGIDQFQRITGPTVSIEQVGSLQLTTDPHVQVTGLTISRPDGHVVARADTARIDIALEQLWTGAAQPGALRLIGAELDLGSQDLELISSAILTAPTAISLNAFKIVDGTLSIDVMDQQFNLADVSVTLGYAGVASPLSLSGQAMWQDLPITLSGRIDTIGSLNAGQFTDLRAALSIAGVDVDFSGRAKQRAEAPLLEGKVSISAAEPHKIASLVRAPGVADLTQAKDLQIQADVFADSTRARVKTSSTMTIAGRDLFVDTTLTAGVGWQEKGPYDLTAISRVGGLYSFRLDGQTDLQGTLWGPIQAAILDAAFTCKLDGLALAGACMDAHGFDCGFVHHARRRGDAGDFCQAG